MIFLINSYRFTSSVSVPVVSSSSYDSAAGEVTMAINSAAGDCTVYWATTASGATPTEAQVRAGTGGGILDAGTFTSSAPSDTDTITATDTTARELHFVVENAAGDTGTPSAGNNTVITGVLIHGFVASYSSSTAGSGWQAIGSPTLQPGKYVLAVYAGGSSGAISEVRLQEVVATSRASESTSPANQEIRFFDVTLTSAGVSDIDIDWTNANGQQAGVGLYFVGQRTYQASAEDAAAVDLILDINTSAGDVVIGQHVTLEATYSAPSATGMTKNFDNNVKGNFHQGGASNFSATGGTPENFELNGGTVTLDYGLLVRYA